MHEFPCLIRMKNKKVSVLLSLDLETKVCLMMVQKLYLELKGDDLYDEMLATYSGREGTKKLEATEKEKPNVRAGSSSYILPFKWVGSSPFCSSARLIIQKKRPLLS